VVLTLDIVLLAFTAVFCLGLAAVGIQRRQFPGAVTFAWLMIALTIWTGLSAIHRLPLAIETRVILAQFHQSRVLDVGVTPLSDQEGPLVGWLVVVRDITERLRAEDERLALDRRLQEQQHTESLTLLAGGLAHDFNNPLAGIMGNADMLTMHLSADTVSRTFDPFFTTKTTGRGLGLASVQGIVRQHHGAFAVRSLEGRGTTVRVWFPTN